MFRTLFTAAIAAALCAGLVFTIIQQARLTPTIIAAEAFEAASDEAVHVHAEGGAIAPHDHAGDEWMPQDGFERGAYTVLANLLAAAGFALIIGAASVVLGLPITAANGVLWGIGGFAAFSLAPAFGLPPGLPGMPVAETVARQIWWWSTAIATGAAILLWVKLRASWTLAAAAGLIVLPHLVGAPQPPAEATGVPAGLAASFAASVLVANAAMWAVLGLVFGLAADWLARRAPVRSVAARAA